MVSYNGNFCFWEITRAIEPELRSKCHGDLTSEIKLSKLSRRLRGVHSVELKMSSVMKKINRRKFTRRDFLISASATSLSIECEPEGQW